MNRNNIIDCLAWKNLCFDSPKNFLLVEFSSAYFGYSSFESTVCLKKLFPLCFLSVAQIR